MPTRYYSSVARRDLALRSGVGDTTDVFLRINGTHASTLLPALPFVLVLERGTSNEELVLVTGITESTNPDVVRYTVTRGYDGTAAKAHQPGVKVEHVTAAIDFREAQERMDAEEFASLVRTV